MASSSNQSQESRTQIPSRESAPVSSTNFKKQKQFGPSVPLSPQLRHPLSRVSPPSSRSFSLSPQTVASIANGSYHKVPSKRCPDNRVWSRDFYLSRNSLLKKMFHQRVLSRTYIDDTVGEFDWSSGLMFFVYQEDCWQTFPIQPPTRLENPKPSTILSLFDFGPANEPWSIAYTNLPKDYRNPIHGIDNKSGTPTSSRNCAGILVHKLPENRHSFKLFGDRPEPHYDGLPFPWVTNTTGTQFPDRWSFNVFDRLYIRGHAECPVCGTVWRIEQCLPERFEVVDTQLGPIGEKINEFGEEVLQTNSVKCEFHCLCDGNENPVRPIISDNLNKINWLFLFLGFWIWVCSIDQLKYYCIQRRLPMSDNKNKMLFTVFDDLCQQIFLRSALA